MQSSLLYILDADVVTAFLCDTIDGRYRMLASADVAGWAQCGRELPDVALTAAAELERTTGRVLLSRGRPAVPEASDGSGADMVAAVAVPQGRLRVAVAGADRDLAFDTCPRLVEGAGHSAPFVLNLDRRDLRSKEVLFDLVRGLWAASPDVVLVAAGINGRAEEEMAAFAGALGAVASVPGPALPVVLFAGDEREETTFRQALGVGMVVERIGRLRPSAEEERLEEGRAALARHHAAKWLATIPGYRRFASWLITPTVHRDIALGRAIRFLAGLQPGMVHAVDLDRRGVGLFLAGQGLFATHRPSATPAWERIATLTAADTGQSISGHEFGNALLRYAAAPSSAQERLVEASWLRELCRAAVGDARVSLPEYKPPGSLSTVIGTGRACGQWADDPTAAMLLLDGLQPAGIGYLAWDGEGILAPAGALAAVQPRLAAELVLEDGANRLGVFVAPTEANRVSSVAIEAEVSLADHAGFKVEVRGGSIESLPSVRGERAVLEVKTATPLENGGGWGKKARVEIDDTPLGIIFDARGRPVAWPDSEASRRAASESWRASLAPATYGGEGE